MLDSILTYISGILTVLVALWFVGRFIRYSHSDERLVNEFMEDVKRRGLTFDEAMDELKIREAIASIRINSSFRARRLRDASVDDYMKVLREEKARAIQEMEKEYPHLTPGLYAIVYELPYDHLFHPDVTRRLDRLVVKEAALKPIPLDPVTRIALKRSKH